LHTEILDLYTDGNRAADDLTESGNHSGTESKGRSVLDAPLSRGMTRSVMQAHRLDDLSTKFIKPGMN
jgi:hypothetical protein